MKSNAAVQTGLYPMEESMKNPAYQAYQILHWGFVVAPILAGLDKFFNKMVDWTVYLWQPLGKLVGGADTFMRIRGLIGARLTSFTQTGFAQAGRTASR